METIKIFNHEGASSEEMETYERRQSTRAIVLDDQNNIALIYSEKLDYYTLPGGTLDKGETTDEAIIRECKEEIGCNVSIISPVGKVLEVRKSSEKIGEIFGYLVSVIGDKGEPELMADEIEEKLITKWVSPKTAKELFHTDIEKNPAHAHIAQRALAFLEEAFPEVG